MGGKPRFNGKPMEHWEKMAENLVLRQLINSAANVDTRSLIGAMASKRFLEIAEAENPDLFYELVEERRRSIEGLATFIDELKDREHG